MPRLTLDFQGTRLEIDDLAAEQCQLFDHGADFLDVDPNGDLTVKREFFERPVEDTYRYQLKWIRGQNGENDWWTLCARDGTPNPEFSDTLDADIERGRPEPAIVMLLESPHRNEYDADFNPLRPAKGQTGKGIHLYFASHVLPLLMHFGMVLDERQAYRVCIVNPVQYQASLHRLLKDKSNEEQRNKLKTRVWWELWPRCKAGFEQRLRDYAPEIVLNGCTGGFKDEVAGVVKVLGQIQHFNISHPSRWQSVLSPFGKA